MAAALQILHVDDKGRLVVSEPNLRELRNRMHAAGINALCVVSVAGSFRTGKSFLLTIMARYLAVQRRRRRSAKEAEESPPPGSDTSWIDAAGSEEAAFEWRGGTERHTTGIWIAGPYRPHRDDDTDAQRVGVLLCDTQGLWDGDSSHKLVTSIFGMSSILSSVCVYNLRGNIDLDKLDQISWFSSFGRSALAQCRYSSDGRVNKRRPAAGATTFQSLHLLVRDWVGYGGDDGSGTGATDAVECARRNREFYKDQRKQKQFDTFVGDLERIYTAVDVMLLPPPGPACCFATDFKGDLGQITRGFIVNVTRYCDTLFRGPLTLKQFNGSIVTPDAFCEITTRFAEIFSSSSTPSTMGFAKAMEKTVTMCARESALAIYRAQVGEGLAKLGTAVLGSESGAAFGAADTDARTKALAAYDRQATYGDAASIAAERAVLIEALAEAAGDARRLAQHRARCCFDDWAPYVLGIFLAWVADRVSDGLCDWWSSNCVALSSGLFRVYSSGGLLLLAMLAFSTHRYGAFPTTQASVALAERMVGMVTDWRASLVTTTPSTDISRRTKI